jgi:hypothetical protein
LRFREVVFRRADREDDVVVTNQDPRDQGNAVIDGDRWEIVSTEFGWGEIHARFIVAVVGKEGQTEPPSPRLPFA